MMLAELNWRNPGATQPAAKRRRIPLACNGCRTRKSKCNGDRPCSMCQHSNLNCRYEVPAQAKNCSNVVVAKESLDEVEKRLQQLETLVRSSRPSMSSASSQESTPTIAINIHRPTPETSRGSGITATTAVATSATNGQEQSEVLAPDYLNSEDDVAAEVSDGMGTIAFTEEEDLAFFGPSSNIAFIRSLTKAISALRGSGNLSPTAYSRPHPDSGHTPSSLIHPPANGPTPGPLSGIAKATSKVSPYILPKHSQVLAILTTYIEQVHPFFPFIHLPTWMATYEDAVQRKFAGVRRTWLSVLNIVMALGSIAFGNGDSIKVSVQEKHRNAEIFYQRARELSKDTLFKVSTTEAVTLWLLMSIYVQSTSRPFDCWNYHCIAIKTALQLGLYSNHALERFPPLERELRKRVWYGCVLQDSVLSMTFGKPSSIPEYAYDLELPTEIEDIHLSNTAEIDPTLINVKPNIITTYNFTLKLYNLVRLIISKIYSHNLPHPEDPSPLEASLIAPVVEIQQLLLNWARSLPPHIKLISASSIPLDGGPPSGLAPFRRQAVILSLKYNYALALLRRPFVSAALADLAGQFSPTLIAHHAKHRQQNKRYSSMQNAGSYGGPGTESKLMGESFIERFEGLCVEACAESAMESIAIISKLFNRFDLLPPSWFILYYVFNSSLVLISVAIIHGHTPVFSPASFDVPTSPKAIRTEAIIQINKHVDMALEILKVLSVENSGANRCRQFLLNLWRYIRRDDRIAPPASTPTSVRQTPALSVAQANSFELQPADAEQQQPNTEAESEPAAVTSETFSQSPYSYTSDNLQYFPNRSLDNFPTPMGVELGEFILENEMRFFGDIMSNTDGAWGIMAMNGMPIEGSTGPEGFGGVGGFDGRDM